MKARGPRKNHQMSVDELLNLPVAVDIATAGRAFGIAPSTAQEWAKRGEFPCRVLRLGRIYRVRRADLFEALGIVEATPEQVTDEPIAHVG